MLQYSFHPKTYTKMSIATNLGKILNTLSWLVLLLANAAAMQVYGQNTAVDSLKRELGKHTEEDTVRVMLLIKLAYSYFSVDKNKSYEYINNCLNLSNKIKFNKGKMYAYNAFGNYYDSNGNYDSSLVYYSKSLNFALTKKDSMGIINGIILSLSNKGYYKEAIEYSYKLIDINKNNPKLLASIYQNMASNYSKQGNYLKGIECEIEALRIYEKFNNTDGLKAISLNIGTSYTQIKQDSIALRFYNKALGIAEKTQDISIKGQALNLIAAVHIRKKEYDKAEKLLKESEQLSIKINDNKLLSSIYEHKAVMYYDNNLIDKAMFFQRKVVSFNKKNGSHYKQSHCYENLASLFIKKREYDSAIFYSHKSLWLANQNNTKLKSIILANTSNLTDIYILQGKTDSAMFFLKKLRLLKDSLLDEKIGKAVLEVEAKYQTEKKDLENAKLKAENELVNQEKQTQFYIFIVLGLVIVGIAFFVFFYNKQKGLTKELAVEKKTRQEVASDIHDKAEPVCRDIVTKFPEAAAEVSILKEHLRNLARRLNVENSVAPLLARLTKLQQYFAQDFEVIVIDRTDRKADLWQKIPNKSIEELYLIADLALNNVRQHAEATQCTITLDFLETNLFRLIIEDNGKGFAADQVQQSMGMGLKNMENRAKQIGASYENHAHPQQGVRIVVELPLT